MITNNFSLLSEQLPEYEAVKQVKLVVNCMGTTLNIVAFQFDKAEPIMLSQI